MELIEPMPEFLQRNSTCAARAGSHFWQHWSLVMSILSILWYCFRSGDTKISMICSDSRNIRMAKTSSLNMIEDLAKDYVAYLKPDLNKETKGVHEAIEDMQMRLEEFESIIRMIQSETGKCTNHYIPLFQMMCPKIIELCKKVDMLEHIILRVNYDLTALEKDVENAESDLGSSEKRFLMLNPLTFFKKAGEPVAPQRIPPEYHPPKIFQTKSFFNVE